MSFPRPRLTVFVFVLALCAIWLVRSADSASQAVAAPAEGGKSQAHLKQAADAIVAATRESVAAAKTDEEAIQQVQLAHEALRYVGMMGASTDPATDKMFDDLQKSAKPAVAEAIIQLRFARQLRNWQQLNAAARKAALDRYAADVQQNGLTSEQAKFVARVCDEIQRAGDGNLFASAITEMVKPYRDSKDEAISRRAELLEGMARRVSLVGKPLELEGTLLDGKKLDWDSYRGKVVLVDFFASWCEECRAEAPNVLKQHQQYRDKGFEVVGVNMDDQAKLAEAYRKETGFQFPTLFSADPKATGWDHPMGRRYGVTALPLAILVDKKGVVVEMDARGPKLEQALQKLLGGGVAGASEPGQSNGVEQASFEEASGKSK